MSDKRILSNAKRDLADIQRFVGAVGVRDLERAFDKGQHRQVDGFPENTGSDGIRRSTEVSDPTGNSVVRQMGRLDKDFVGDTLREAFDKLHKMQELSIEVAQAFDLERHVHEQAAKREVPAGQGDCMVCESFCSGAENDRLKAGFCSACYRAWARYVEASPGGDRVKFIDDRRAKLADGDKVTSITARQVG